MTDNLEKANIEFGILNIIYIIIFICLHWTKPIGSIPIWEIIMLWVYVVITPFLVIGLVILIIVIVS